jgi:hypothetical protein
MDLDRVIDFEVLLDVRLVAVITASVRCIRDFLRRYYYLVDIYTRIFLCYHSYAIPTLSTPFFANLNCGEHIVRGAAPGKLN